MDTCKDCSSSKLISITAKCKDMCVAIHDGREYEGYAPHTLNIGGGDYIEFTYCAECGKIQDDNFPILQEDLDRCFSDQPDEDE